MDRIAIPLLLPLTATVLTVLIIVTIGNLLLFVEHDFGSGVAVAVALAIAGAILAGCTLAARGGTPEHRGH